jgi:hypothetical protein
MVRDSPVRARHLESCWGIGIGSCPTEKPANGMRAGLCEPIGGEVRNDSKGGIGPERARSGHPAIDQYGDSSSSPRGHGASSPMDPGLMRPPIRLAQGESGLAGRRAGQRAGGRASGRVRGEG